METRNPTWKACWRKIYYSGYFLTSWQTERTYTNRKHIWQLAYISDSSLTLKKTLFIIDGKEVEPKVLNEINPDQISSINVIKDGTGVTIFGPKARDGVILITTKRSSTTSQGESLVTGRVTDAAGNPVSGACITIKGTTTQTTSDNEGRFTLTVPRKDATLEVSSSNMKTATVGAQPLLKVALEKE